MRKKCLSLPDLTPEALKRFYASFTMMDNPRDCWIWEKNCNPDWGYGKFSFNGVYYMAHRYAYKLHYGKDPGELLVCHDCPDGDNPACVNPKHLFLGTDSDNNWDKVKKGRHHCGKGLNNGRHTKPENYQCFIGERNHSAKLTENQVREIRRRYDNGEQRAVLVKEFGVHFHSINRIVFRTGWKHVI